MKKLSRQNPIKKITVFAGALALMTFAPKTHAQSSVDALLDKLEQKGILTSDETKELKAENEQDATNDFSKAFNAIFPMPDWVTGYKLSGDFRGRIDDITMNSPLFPDRLRFRYRIRVGIAVEMKDNLELGFRAGSGDPSPGTGFGGNPLSNNSTFQDDFSKKSLYVDAAYGKWSPIKSDNWTLTATIGKMDNPFQLTPMVFDPDLTPEGVALQNIYKFSDNQSISWNAAAFVLDELKLSTRDPFMYGGQIVWNANWTPVLATSLGVSAFDIVNKSGLAATAAGANSSVPYVNQGNTRAPNTSLVPGALMENFNPIIADASVTYKLDSFPLYTGQFPVKFAVEFMDNPGAESENQGAWAGVTLGKSGKKGTWDLSYRYEYLENNAWYDQLVDDDNGATYVIAPFLGGGTGFYGGTGIKGHQVKLNYSVTDALTFTFTCYINELIHGVPSSKATQAIHMMADLMWKF